MEPLRVMVVDDDPVVRSQLTRILSQRRIDVDAFADSSQALRHLEAGRHDIVVSDQRLPGGLCGHEFLLAAQTVDADVVTILLADEDLPATAESASQRLDASMRKPISPDRLLDVWRSAKRQAA